MANGIASGIGTIEYPYIIDNWDISASSAIGIVIQNTDAYFIIRNCTIHDGSPNHNRGIYLSNVNNGKIMNCAIQNNNCGIYMESSNTNIIINNSITSDTYDAFGAIFLSSSYNNAISNNNVSANTNIGVNLINGSIENKISYNHISSNSEMGIVLTGISGVNSIFNNNISSNEYCGIYLGSTSLTSIYNNSISSNSQEGIRLAASNQNSLYNNNISLNKLYGINLMLSSTNNHIYYNNFINNNFSKDQGYDDIGTNFWNAETKGNYWSDWISPDIDHNGIVDIPYNISGGTGSKDNFPLTNPLMNSSTANVSHLARVVINPKEANMMVGFSKVFSAQAYDTNNKTLDNVTYNWWLSNVTGGGNGFINTTKGAFITFNATFLGSLMIGVRAVYTLNNTVNTTAIINISSSPPSNKTFIILGNVTDVNLTRIPNAKILLDSTDHVVHMEVSTNVNGSYSFVNLSSAKTYIISVNVSGYIPFTGILLSSNEGKVIVYNIILKMMIKKSPGVQTFSVMLVISGIIIILAVGTFISLVFPGLLSRLRHERTLDHFVRGQLYNYITLNPGSHYNTLKKALHLSNGTLTYHLHTLEMQGFIKSKRDGIFKCFYVMGVKPQDGEGIRYSDLQVRIINAIKKDPGLCQTDLADKLNVPLSVLTYNIKILVKFKAIRIENGEGRRKHCYIAEGPVETTTY